ncbi:hypothetical protein [Pontibacter ruber]|uniref:Uncharacterized protein n=1 Tax=Pontibacter ruber TaxID=1343895 RepID=A0ABW5CVQ9_9BACT|nr:hypothetical protein [Pontibacter ruber]
MKQTFSLWILLGLVLMAPGLATATVATAAVTAPDAPASADSVTKKGWWTAELEVANNSSFYGRSTAQRYPYASTSLTYLHQSGLWASATSYQLFDTEDFIDETDVSVGYTYLIGKRGKGNILYSHFFFSENSPLLKSVTNNALTAKTEVDWKYLYTALTTSYFFGGSSDLFVVLDNSRYIALNPLWNGKRAIGLDPKVSITAGTQEFSETYTVEKKPGFGGVLDPLRPGNGKNGSTTTTTTTHKFRILNYDFLVPVVVNFGNFEVEPSWRYSIPVNLLEGDESKAQSFYSIKANYTF